MGEALPKYTPANDHGEEVSLKIISSIDKTSDRFDNLRPERFTESHQNDDDLEEEGEMESYGVDSPEGLLKAREYTRSLSSALSEWEASPGDVYDNGRIVLDYLRQQISDINDLIHYQNDAFASGAADKEIQQRAEKIVEAINLLSADYESLSIAAEDETGTVMAELADEVRGMKNLEKTVETKSEEENISGTLVRSKLKQLEKTARSYVNNGLERQKNDYSEHMPGQNKRLMESLFLARDEVMGQIALLREKLNRREGVSVLEIYEIEEEIQRMQRAFDMLPSVNKIHTKEDFETPKDLDKTEIEELKHLSTKADILPLSLVADLTQERFALIQDDYEELQVLTESVQQEASRILTQGSYFSREKEAVNQTLREISQIRRKIEEKVLSNDNDTEEVEEEMSQENSGERKNFVAYPISEDTTSRKTIHVNGVPMGSYPLEKKGAVMMSHNNPEELFPESDEPELTAERIEEYRDWVETPDTEEEAQVSEIVEDTDIPNIDNLVNVTPPLQGDILPPEVGPLYARTRAEWRETGQAHLEAHQAYRDALAEHYTELQEQSFGKKFWTRTKATFGFKPELPEEIVAMRDDMFAKTEAYNALAKKMVEQRVRGGKEQASEKVLERYRSMLARTLLLNTFDEQLSAQKKATEDLAFGQSEFMKKHSKAIRFTGAAAIGGLTGGVFGAGAALARTLTGAAVTGVATGAVGEWQDRRVNRISSETAEKRAMEISSIEAMLKRGSLTKEELEEAYQYLSGIYHEVDKATQVKIAAILATVIASSFVLGEVVDAVSTPDSISPTVAPDVAGGDRLVIDVSTDPNTAAVGGAEAAGAPSTTEYTVQRGDNLWDIMEGQTEAGNFSALEGLSEADRQEAIARLAETFNENEELRERFGMGDTADMLYADEKIDTAALNEMLADEIKEHNIGVGEAVESPVDSSSNTEAPAGGDVGAGGEASDAGADSGAAPTEKVLMKSVSVDAINEYAREYTGGGYVKFEQDFEKLFVERVQGPAPATGGLMSFIFGGAPNTADAYKLFSPYTIAEFNELNRVSESALAEALARDGIDINDYRAWRDELRDLRAQGMTINPTDRFEDVAKAAFINSLNQPKTT